MIQINQINSEEELKDLSREDIINFLYTHLERFRDEKDAISKCLGYTFSKNNGKGGFILSAHIDGNLVGVVVTNKTGMGGYIPENILVYIAVDQNYRGKGIGKRLMEETIKRADGAIKLHVEYDNPAKRLYERMGFTTKYDEMRYTKKK